MLFLKETVSRDFWPSFFKHKRFDLGPIWTGKNVFAEIFDCKVLKSGVCVVKDYAEILDFLDTEIFIFLNNDYWMCKRLIVPLKSVRSLQSFLKVSAKSLTTPTPWPHSRWLRGHRVRVVIDYANMVLAYSATLLISIFENINFHFLLLFFFFLSFSKVK